MDYIKIPKGLCLDMLREEFGYPAVDWYLNRIEERRELGHKYFNPLKTVYIWQLRTGKLVRGFIQHIQAGCGERNCEIMVDLDRRNENGTVDYSRCKNR